MEAKASKNIDKLLLKVVVGVLVVCIAVAAVGYRLVWFGRVHLNGGEWFQVRGGAWKPDEVTLSQAQTALKARMD